MTWVNDCVICPKTYSDVLESCYEGHEGNCDGVVGFCKLEGRMSWLKSKADLLDINIEGLVVVSVVLDLLEENGIISKEIRSDISDHRNHESFMKDFDKVIETIIEESKW